jgi:predicted phosphodiesterase
MTHRSAHRTGTRPSRYLQVALSLVFATAAACSPDKVEEPAVALPDNPGEYGETAAACAHPLCATGAKLTKSCNPCVKQICAKDAYCCNTSWNSICVAEVGSVCGQTCGGPPDMATAADMSTGGPDLGGHSGRFRFAAFGDTRPGSAAVGSPYPTAVVEAIFRSIDRQAVDFVVVSGDYIYVSGTDATRAAAQMDLFLAARTQLSASTKVHYVLGNHEDKNIPTFQAKLSPQVYWRINQGDVKVVAIANDAWDSTQGTWLEAQLADKTKYTFVFRHQYWGSHGTTHDAEIRPIVDAHPYTLFIAGHDHAYKHKTTVIRGDQREVVAGNGGAPFDTDWTTGTQYYGYILVEQQPDDRVRVTAYKVEPGMDVPPVAMDTWTVSP